MEWYFSGFYVTPHDLYWKIASSWNEYIVCVYCSSRFAAQNRLWVTQKRITCTINTSLTLTFWVVWRNFQHLLDKMKQLIMPYQDDVLRVWSRASEIFSSISFYSITFLVVKNTAHASQILFKTLRSLRSRRNQRCVK